MNWYVVDTTLRDGEQAPGVVFRPADRVAIAVALAAAGVAEIEVGIPAMGAAAQRDIGHIRDAFADRDREAPRLTAWCRARVDDLAAAADCGLRAAHCGLPVSPIQLGALRHDQEWCRQRLERCLAFARRHFAFVSIGLQDVARTPVAVLHELASVAAAHGADRIRLADSVGAWLPWQVPPLIAGLREVAGDCAIGVHTHNDLGLATANALAALAAGADCCDVTVNGLGERAGNAALAEVVCAARQAGLDTGGVSTDALTPLARQVAAASDRPLPPQQPLVGGNCFRHESGIHVQSQLVDRRAYELIEPELVGQCSSEHLIGLHSGGQALIAALAAIDISCQPAETAILLPRVRALAQRLRRDLHVDELRQLHHRLIAEARSVPERTLSCR